MRTNNTKLIEDKHRGKSSHLRHRHKHSVCRILLINLKRSSKLIEKKIKNDITSFVVHVRTVVVRFKVVRSVLKTSQTT